MSSTEKQGDVATQRKEDSISDKEKGQGDAKSETSPHKRSASELNSADDEIKQKVLKTDHKEEKENGESEEKYEECDDDDDDVVPEGDDYDEEGDDGEGDGDEDGADDDDEEEEDA